MGLKPSKQTIGDAVPKLYKWFELYAGGFSIISTNLRDGVTLPAGSLFKVDESTRQATPIKTAKMATYATATQKTLTVENASYFKEGDLITSDGNSGTGILSIAGNVITLATGIGAVATGVVVYQAAAAGGAVLAGTANTLSAYDVKVGEDSLSEGVTVLRRGTAYKRRIQPHLAGNLTNIPATIQLSESF